MTGTPAQPLAGQANTWLLLGAAAALAVATLGAISSSSLLCYSPTKLSKLPRGQAVQFSLAFVGLEIDDDAALAAVVHLEGRIEGQVTER